MPNYRLTVEYDGTDFEGWQLQAAGHRTVQGALEHAFAHVVGERVPVRGAGRTDAGVHAEGQVATARSPRAFEPADLQRAVNTILPEDVVVVAVSPAPDAFDPCRDATSKLYRYALWNGPTRSPLRSRRAYGLLQRLDLDSMHRAAADLVGTHDFASFQTAGSGVATTERTLLRLDVAGDPGGEVAIHCEATGFLRHMVRIIAGTLLEVARGRRDPASMPALLAARDRSQAGPTAPARGLTLVRVTY